MGSLPYMRIAATAKSSGSREMTRAPVLISVTTTRHSAAVTSPPTLELRSCKAAFSMPSASFARATNFRSTPVEVVLPYNRASSSLDSSHLARTLVPLRRSGNVITVRS